MATSTPSGTSTSGSTKSPTFSLRFEWERRIGQRFRRWRGLIFDSAETEKGYAYRTDTYLFKSRARSAANRKMRDLTKPKPVDRPLVWDGHRFRYMLPTEEAYNVLREG